MLVLNKNKYGQRQGQRLSQGQTITICRFINGQTKYIRDIALRPQLYQDDRKLLDNLRNKCNRPVCYLIETVCKLHTTKDEEQYEPPKPRVLVL